MQNVFAVIVILFGAVLVTAGISGQYPQLLALVGIQTQATETEKLVR